MADAADIGQRVLAILAAGRAAAIARARERAAGLQLAVLDELHNDCLAGKPERGRAGRIHRRLKHRHKVSSRHVKRILDGLASVSDSPR